jgi:TIR domain/inactive STAND
MSFVFVSHASQDKPRIRHIVDALIADGHKVWLDDPAAMGYGSDQIEADFIRLHAGTRWKDEIDEAVSKAGAVLVCFSRRFNEPRRDTLYDEIAIARARSVLVACRIDDVDTQALPNQLPSQQMPNVQPEAEASGLKTALKLLMEDIRLKLNQTNGRKFEMRSQQGLDPDTPYLIDRTAHEEQIGEIIEHVDQNGGVGAFFVAGPENECVDEFIRRVERHTCPHLLNGRLWHPLVVEWPTDLRGPDFSKTFLRRCASQLRQPHTASEAAIAEALGRIGRPVAVLSRLTASEWQADEDKRVCEWLQLWHRLAGQPARFSALPILCLTMPPAEPGWKIYPKGTAPGASMSNAAIWSVIDRLHRPSRWQKWFARREPEQAEIKVPPLLHPVSQSDARNWLDHRIVASQLGDDPADAKARIKNLFNGRAAIPLETFADRMKPLFQGGV